MTRVRGRLLIGSVAYLGCLLQPQFAQSARSAALLQGRSWEQIKRLPDWSGVWQATEFRRHVYEIGVVPWKDLQPPFTPQAQVQFEQLKAVSLGHGDIPTRSDHCISLGVPGDMDYPQTRFQWLFTPGQVTLAGSEQLRRIYTDGGVHTPLVDTFEGMSVGHWEAGGVLVVETGGLDAGNEFILGFKQGAGSHVSERIYLKNRDLLVDDVVLTAPAVLSRPWSYQLTFERDPQPLAEFDCAQAGGRDIDPASGQQWFDLVPPSSQ